MKLKITKSDALDDWYVVERADVEAKQWSEPTAYGSRLMVSTRLSDADCEGTAAHMLALADAIAARERWSAKRCGVFWASDGAKFYSPRNSDTATCVMVLFADADDLAGQIRALLGAVVEAENA